MSPAERAEVTAIALEVGVPAAFLYGLIQLESSWNPFAANPYSTARGLLQWTDASAREMGYASAAALLVANPDVLSQLRIVRKWFQRFVDAGAPDREQAVAMSVFYPAAARWPANTPFPARVQRVNPGIQFVSDYVNKIRTRAHLWIVASAPVVSVAFAAVLVGAAAWWWLRG